MKNLIAFTDSYGCRHWLKIRAIESAFYNPDTKALSIYTTHGCEWSITCKGYAPCSWIISEEDFNTLLKWLDAHVWEEENA